MSEQDFRSDRHDHKAIEKKWQDVWARLQLDTADISDAPKPYYNLMMFPYPSAEGLHVGNMYAFTGSDIHGRYMRMMGYDVFEPIGLDGFGIHSENYALKVGRHPKKHAEVTEQHFYKQLHHIGGMFDWNRTLETYDPDYYRWTQWLFVQMFQHGLAYRKKAHVNFCPSCRTVLADEQVIDGKCERCGNTIEKRALDQWFFRITAFAEKLLGNIPKLDWSEKVKIAQTNWIGKKEGITISYPVVTEEGKEIGAVDCFTTRPDTNFGATFVVLAPEHDFVTTLIKIKDSSFAEATEDKQRLKIKDQEIQAYVEASKKKSEQERLMEGRKKTGVFTGLYCVNRLNNTKLPLYISDFVVVGFGTGAVVGVPGHDRRDFEFADVMDIPVVRVVVGKDGDRSAITKPEQVQEEEGTVVNSQFLDGLNTHEAIVKIMDHLEEKGWGKRVITYHLRDWLISRQRYWGPPIPMIYCEHCKKEGVGERDEMPGWYSVPLKDFPVILPDIEDYKPGDDGIAPLAKHKEFYYTKCPHCGKTARRETDVSDTFLDSSWYFLRYPSLHQKQDKEQDDKPFNQTITKKWLPVHMYTGGAEHSVLHLLYSRFITMALHSWEFLGFEEPFSTFFAHGLVIKDGAKMSKSKGNIVNPDEYIEKYGADALRMYLMFMGPFSDGGDFRDTGMEGMVRWTGRIWRLVTQSAKEGKDESEKEIHRLLQKTIAKISKDMPNRRYNTAIAAMMEFTNAAGAKKGSLGRLDAAVFVRLLAPFSPHLAEELWNQLQNREIYTDPKDSVHKQPWPVYDKDIIKDDLIPFVIQVNGKVRDTLYVAPDDAKMQKKMEGLALKSEKVQKYVSEGNVKKTVFVPGKLLNVVLI